MKKLAILAIIASFIMVAPVFAQVYPGELIPNSGFEEGILGEVPTHWTAEYTIREDARPGICIHDLEKSDVAYYEGSHSLYGRAYFRTTEYIVVIPSGVVYTWAHSEYVNASYATTATIFMRDISVKHPPGWGWNTYIQLVLDDGVNHVTHNLYQHGQTIRYNTYDATALGADGQTWYRYTRDIPSNLDKTHLRVSILWIASSWYWYPGAVTEISSHVDNVLLLPIPATVDLDPDILNLKSRGKWITCYIELPEGYDVADIDVDTVYLETVPADITLAEIGDYDLDGIPDLMVKFDRTAVAALLSPADVVELTVTGELVDGTPFEGTDTIRVID